MVSVAVTERRACQLTETQRQAIADSDGFWDLAEAGFVSYRRSGQMRHEIVGHRYVGRAVLGDLEVRVDEKAQGTVLALVNAATGAELRVIDSTSPATEFDVISRHLMREFVSAAGSYIAHRRTPSYDYRNSRGPVLSGALDLPRTMVLNASGHVGQFAYAEGRVIRDEPLDRVVLAGLDELDRSAAALGLPGDVLYDARWLAGALDEVRDQTFLATSRDDFLSVAGEVASGLSTFAEDADLARLSTVALLHQGFEPDRPGHGTVPRAWFIDLETLFERAVRETLRTLLSPCSVDRGEVLDRRMFFGGSDKSRTHPDLVLHGDAQVLAVGDVKYKSLRAAAGEELDEEEAVARRKKEGRPDIYQVLVHAASVSAPIAFLVYVSDDEYVSRFLGTAATGSATWAVQIRPKFLAKDLSRFATEAGLLS